MRQGLPVFISGLLVLLLAACSGRDLPEVPLLKARIWNTSVNGRVLGVYDTFDHRGYLNSNEPEVTHVIVVEILDAEQPDTRYIFPYDSWGVGKPPPVVGTELIFSPASWVTRAVDSKGVPNPLHHPGR